MGGVGRPGARSGAAAARNILSDVAGRKCLICYGVENHPVHARSSNEGRDVERDPDGRRLVKVYGAIYRVHAYDPGERRRKPPARCHTESS